VDAEKRRRLEAENQYRPGGRAGERAGNYIPAAAAADVASVMQAPTSRGTYVHTRARARALARLNFSLVARITIFVRQPSSLPSVIEGWFPRGRHAAEPKHFHVVCDPRRRRRRRHNTALAPTKCVHRLFMHVTIACYRRH